MTISQLKAFITLCGELNYTSAAEKLYMSRQALRQNIQALESELDKELFINRANHISLSPAGEILLKESREVTEAFDALEKKLFDVQKFGKTIKICVSSAVIPDFLPQLKAYCDSFAMHEHMHMEFTERCNDEAALAVLNGEADCGIVMDLRAKREGLERFEISSHVPSVFVSSRHRFFNRDSVSRIELDGETICMPGTGAEVNLLTEGINSRVVIAHSYYQVYFNVRENNYIAINRYIPAENLTPEHTRDIIISDAPPLCSALIAKSGSGRKIKELAEFLKAKYERIFI